MTVPVSLLHWFLSVLEFLLFIIPAKLLAANFVGRSTLADAAYSVL